MFFMCNVKMQISFAISLFLYLFLFSFLIKDKFINPFKQLFITGADPEFSFGGGGGGRKRLCARTHGHVTSAEPNSLSAGLQGT